MKSSTVATRAYSPDLSNNDTVETGRKPLANALDTPDVPAAKSMKRGTGLRRFLMAASIALGLGAGNTACGPTEIDDVLPSDTISTGANEKFYPVDKELAEYFNKVMAFENAAPTLNLTAKNGEIEIIDSVASTYGGGLEPEKLTRISENGDTLFYTHTSTDITGTKIHGSLECRYYLKDGRLVKEICASSKTKTGAPCPREYFGDYVNSYSERMVLDSKFTMTETPGRTLQDTYGLRTYIDNVFTSLITVKIR